MGFDVKAARAGAVRAALQLAAALSADLSATCTLQARRDRPFPCGTCRSEAVPGTLPSVAVADMLHAVAAHGSMCSRMHQPEELACCAQRGLESAQRVQGSMMTLLAVDRRAVHVGVLPWILMPGWSAETAWARISPM